MLLYRYLWLELNLNILSTSASENLANLLRVIGDNHVSDKETQKGIVWLKRGFQLVSGKSGCSESIKAKAGKSIFDACLNEGTKSELNFCREVLESIQKDSHYSLWASFAEYELERKAHPSGTHNALRNIVDRVTSTKFSPDIVKEIITQVMKFPQSDFNGASQILETCAKQVLCAQLPDLLEQFITAKIWLLTRNFEICSSETCISLTEFLNSVYSEISTPLSSKAIYACHALIWKISDKKLEQHRYEECQNWCDLARHPCFQRSDQNINVYKISRRCSFCLMQNRRFTEAREVILKIPNGESSILNLLLLFKAELRCETNAALITFEKIVKHPDAKHNHLLACIVEAQDADSLPVLRFTLVKALKIAQNEADLEVNSLTLLRCILKLTKHEELQDSPSHLNDLCTLLEKSLRKISASVNEITWFLVTIYNFCVSGMSSWDHASLRRMLSCCLEFSKLYPLDIDSATSKRALTIQQSCYYLHATSLVFAARNGNDSQTISNQYHEAIDYCNQFQLSVGRCPLDEVQKLKLSCILSINFEGNAHLKAWEKLQEIVEVTVC